MCLEYILFILNVIICFAARSNIGVVIALWAPIILVRVYAFSILHLSIFGLIVLVQYCSNICTTSRYILWIPKSGMPYSLRYLEVSMVHFVDLGRLVKLPSSLCNLFFYASAIFLLFVRKSTAFQLDMVLQHQDSRQYEKTDTVIFTFKSRSVLVRK